MKSYNGTIAENWLPTFENVTREFITETLYKILFSEEIPNFKFVFMEDEAINFIKKVLNKYTQKYEFYKEKAQEIIKELEQKSNNNSKAPVMIVNNYKQFFELLRQFYEKDIELYFSRTKMSGFPRYEKDNCFEQIWLRATPDDFNDPEQFLKKQVDMINENTFEKYDDEKYIGRIDFLDGNILCIKNGIARTWDENSRQIEITIYDKNYYYKDLIYRPCYILPLIRYGIYEKNGHKICFIGSIQDKNDNYKKNDLNKKINRKKYKLNEGVAEEDTYKVEPKKLLALSIFINMLHKEGISEIEIPCLYALDFEYHTKKSRQSLLNFEKKWNKKEREKYPEQYNREKYYFERIYKKEELISEIKTERFLLTFKRLLNHYPNGNILSYPGEVDSFMHINIPIVKSENDINGTIFKKLYKILETPEQER